MNGFVVMAIDSKPKRTVRKIVEQRAVARLCLHCDKPVHRRGLCITHYHEFRMKRLSKPEGQRKVWDAHQVHEGNVLEAGVIVRAGKTGPFDDE